MKYVKLLKKSYIFYIGAVALFVAVFSLFKMITDYKIYNSKNSEHISYTGILTEISTEKRTKLLFDNSRIFILKYQPNIGVDSLLTNINIGDTLSIRYSELDFLSILGISNTASQILEFKNVSSSIYYEYWYQFAVVCVFFSGFIIALMNILNIQFWIRRK